MKFLDLFAGIGGFRLGMERAGHECVGYVEWDKFARKSYEAIHNTEGEWTAHDITSVTDDDIRQLRNRGRIDVICGGFPCQAFSVAGKRKGFDDTRGTLFFEIARFANIIRPRYLFLENVKGLLNHAGGDTFETILRTLDELGYDAEWDVLNSKDFGVPQNRERVFIIGHLRGSGGRKVFPVGGTDGQTNLPIQIVAHHKNFRRNIQTFSPEGITETLDAAQGGGRGHYVLLQELVTRKGRGPDSEWHTRDTATCLDANYFKGLDAHQARTGVRVREATKKGFDTAFPGDSINYSLPTSNTRRGRVGKGIANTLDTGCQQGVVVWDMYNKKERTDGNVGTLTTKGNTSSTNGGTFGIDDGIRIRKLTPRECWRLQGYPDWAFDKAAEVNSDSQLYKQAGNGVTENVIYEIAKRLS